MIKLTDRLQMMADQVENNETMADIGTDHGFLPIYLWENNISPEVIMADISPGSLDKARMNAHQLYPCETFDLRLGNGIQILDNGEVDDVVIAGMGGKLMTQILGEDLEKSKSFKKLILQPRNGQAKLRQWLVENGFHIIKESLVRENKYICEILTVIPEDKGNTISYKLPEDADPICYEVPPWIVNSGPLVEPFVKNKIAIEEYALNGIMKAGTIDEKRLAVTKGRIEYLNSLIGGK